MANSQTDDDVAMDTTPRNSPTPTPDGDKKRKRSVEANAQPQPQPDRGSSVQPQAAATNLERQGTALGQTPTPTQHRAQSPLQPTRQSTPFGATAQHPFGPAYYYPQQLQPAPTDQSHPGYASNGQPYAHAYFTPHGWVYPQAAYAQLQQSSQPYPTSSQPVPSRSLTRHSTATSVTSEAGGTQDGDPRGKQPERQAKKQRGDLPEPPIPQPERPPVSESEYGNELLLQIMRQQQNTLGVLQTMAGRLDRLDERVYAREPEVDRQGGKGKQRAAMNEGDSDDRNMVVDDEEGLSDGEMDDKDEWLKPTRCGTRAWNKFMKSCNSHILFLLGLKTTKMIELRSLPLPLDDTEVSRLRVDTNGEFWNKKTFRIDFSRPWTFPPNQSAMRLFRTTFRLAVQAGKFKVEDYLLTDVILEGRFYQFFNYVKPLVQKAQAEEEEEQVDEGQKARKAQNTRRKTLYQHRLEAAISRSKLRRHARLISKLKPQHMSDDEPYVDGQVRRFKILSNRWRSQPFTDLLRDLDKVHAENSNHPWRTGQTSQPRGNRPRLRDDLGDIQDGVAPHGLPANCYDPKWLQTRPLWFRDQIKPDYNKTYDFTVDQDELRPAGGNSHDADDEGDGGRERGNGLIVIKANNNRGKGSGGGGQGGRMNGDNGRGEGSSGAGGRGGRGSDRMDEDNDRGEGPSGVQQSGPSNEVDDSSDAEISRMLQE